MDLPSRKQRGSPKRGFVDVVREDMQVVCMRKMQGRGKDGGQCSAVVTPRKSQVKLMERDKSVVIGKNKMIRMFFLHHSYAFITSSPQAQKQIL